jgi:5S rRNA maturation endonuclease (ribonuclease M5)
MSRAVQRRATKSQLIPDSPKRFQSFIEFLYTFIRELDDLASEGAVVLVEGKRDMGALRQLGYKGPLVTASMLHTKECRSLTEAAKTVVILTDLDTEGRKLAARYVKAFSARGIETSLAQRRRFSRASKGVFLHVENLKRFAPLHEQVSL